MRALRLGAVRGARLKRNLPALLLHVAPGSGAKLETGSSERQTLCSEHPDRVCVTRAIINSPAIIPAAA